MVYSIYENISGLIVFIRIVELVKTMEFKNFQHFNIQIVILNRKLKTI
jgi:hypothetical protein